jgi:hypothetical protein
MNKNIRVMYRGINEFKKGYKHKIKFVKEEGLYTCGSSKDFEYIEELLKSVVERSRAGGVRQKETQIAEPYVP